MYVIDWIKDKALALYLGGYLGSLVRSGLKAVAGYLIAQKVMPQASAEQWIAVNAPVAQGVAILAAAQLWSWIKKAHLNSKAQF